MSTKKLKNIKKIGLSLFFYNWSPRFSWLSSNKSYLASSAAFASSASFANVSGDFKGPLNPVPAGNNLPINTFSFTIVIPRHNLHLLNQ